MDEKPLVVIRCITYNHEPFIRDALEGFVMQKTSFPFVAVVHDDASTDGTASIIREYAEKYPNIIKPIYETENQYSKRDGSLRRIMNEACDATGAKYIAFCEGDDYWIDPLKLQKQVDFLEANPEYGMCYTMSKPYIQSKNKFGNAFGGELPNTFESYAYENRIPTQSVVLNHLLFIKYNNEINPASHPEWRMGDYPIYLWMAYNSLIHFIPEVTSVYRILDKSASHFSSNSEWIKFRINAFEISKFFTDLYDPSLSKIPYQRILWYKLELAVFDNDLNSIHETKNLLVNNCFYPQNIKSKILFYTCRYPKLLSFSWILFRNTKKVFRNLFLK